MFQYTPESIQEVLNSSHEAIFIHDSKSGKIVFVNQRVCELYNCTFDEALELSVGKLSLGKPPYSEKDALCLMQKAQKEGAQIFEWIARKKTSETFWAEVVLRSLKIGRKSYIIAVVRDISLRKKADDEKQKTMSQLQAILDACTDVIAIVNDKGFFLGGNKAFLSRWGKSYEQIIGHSASEILPPHIFKSRLAKIKQVIISKESVTFIDNYNGKWFENTISPVIETDGNASTVAMFSKNITDRVKADNALRESEERYRILVEQAADGIFHGDAEGNFIGVNTKCIEMTGYSEKELLKMNMSDLFTKDEQKRVPLRYDLLKQGQVVKNERWLTKKNGSICFIEMHTKMMPDKTYQSIFRDITERKKTEQTVKESEAHYRTIFENTGTATVIIEEDTIISLANSKFEELSGYTKQEVENKKSWKDFVVQDDLERMAEQHKQRRLNGQAALKSYEFHFVDKKGEEKYILLTIDLIPNTKRSVASLLDISERKKSENEIRESEQRYRLLFEHNPVPLLIYERESLWLLAVNEAFLKHYGYTNSQILSMKLPDLYPEDQKKPIVELAKRIQGHAYAGEWKHIKANGTLIYIFATSHEITFENKKARIAVINDITERKQTEIALRESEEKYRTVIESATDSIIIIKDGIIQFVNKVIVELSGYSEKKLLGKSFIDFVSPKDKEKVQEYYKKRISGDTAPVGYELNALKKNGEEVPFEITATVFNFKSEKAELVFLHDITERKLIENKILRINEELEERVELRTRQLESANKELEAFAYSVSHDLRAPLRAISGFTKILTEDYSEKIENEGQRICSVIQNEASRMGQLIDDLLAFSRLSKTSMQTALSDMTLLVQQIFNETKKQYENTEVNFIFDKLLPSKVDISLMRQVWVNLLSNAFKFSSRKKITEIEVGSYEKPGEIVYFVKDNGAGFDMKYADKLFGVFQRLHNLNEFQGTGVGLAIVQRIVHRHGGRVWAEGEIDKGAKFYFSIPDKK